MLIFLLLAKSEGYGSHVVAWLPSGAIAQVCPKVICWLRRVVCASGRIMAFFVLNVWCRWIGPYSGKDYIRVMFCVGICQIPGNEEVRVEGRYGGLLSSAAPMRQ